MEHEYSVSKDVLSKLKKGLEVKTMQTTQLIFSMIY